MTLYDSVLANLKSVIGSRRDGVQLSFLDTEYVSMVGEHFPLRKLGYDTIYDFINSHHEHFRMEGAGKYCRVINMVGRVEDETTLDLINLIQSTKPKSKRKRGGIINLPNKSHSFPSNFRQPYYPNIQPNFHPNYQNNFVYTAPPLRFTHPCNYNDPFVNPFNLAFRFPSNGTETKVKSTGFTVKPDVELKFSNTNDENKKANLIVPRQCLVSSKVTAEKASVLVISDEDECGITIRPEVASQTLQREYKSIKRLFCTFQFLELVNVIIDVIIEFKQLRYNDIIKIKIDGDLYFHFRQLTGISIDPALFNDYVVQSIDSPKTQHIHKGLIYLDPSKSHCLFNIKSTYKTRNRLPEYEFDYGKEYIVEIVKIFHDNLIAYKISNKLNPILDWKKTVTSDQNKDIIETQLFWSWIPGSLCLVQLPYSLVIKFSLSAVERAIIISSDIPVLMDEKLRDAQPYIIHNTSFYLIDQEIEIEDLLSCASSYQEVKLKAKEKNNSEITFVCNMSICAMNTPSKIQFTKLKNFKDISQTFLDKSNQLHLNTKIVLKNIKKMTLIFHFQSIHSSCSSLYTGNENPQEMIHDKICNDTTSYQNNYDAKDTKVDYSDVIVLSDDDDDVITDISSKNSLKDRNPILNSPVTPQYSQTKTDIKPLIFNNFVLNHTIVSSYLDKVISNPVMADASILRVCESSNKMVKIGDDRATAKTSQPFYSEKIAFKIASTKSNNVNLRVNDYFDKVQSHVFSPNTVQPFCPEKISFKIAPPRTFVNNTNWRLNESLEVPKHKKEVTTVDKTNVPITSHYELVPLQISPIKNGSCINFAEKQTVKPENHLHVNGFSSTPNSVKKTNETISVVSYSESEEAQESLNNLINAPGKNQNDVTLSTSVINYLENNQNPPRKCLRPLTTDMVNSFCGKLVKLLHIQTGTAVIMLQDSVKLMKREIKMMSLKKQDLQKADTISVGDFYIWRKQSDIAENTDFILVEIMQVVSTVSALTNNVHYGLLSVVNVEDLFCLPEDKNGDIYGSIQTLLGPSIGAFDLHMFPDWFTPDDQFNCSNDLFTAYFVDGKLVLEYFEEPCKFLNIEIITSIEKSLTVNHCNTKSTHFIQMLSKNLLQCRLYIGNVLEMVTCEDVSFDDFSITKALRKVTSRDSCDVWFASVITTNGELKQDCYSKLSPHNFMDDQFCIDRVTYDERKHHLHLMEYQNVNIEVPDNFEGLYKFDKNEIKGSLKGHEEFYSRYMLAGAAGIPDLKYLHNKLIFDIREF